MYLLILYATFSKINVDSILWRKIGRVDALCFFTNSKML
jgi:hypothetical protein